MPKYEKNMSKINKKLSQVDISMMLVPFALVVFITVVFFAFPKETENFLKTINVFFRDKTAFFYLFLSFGCFILLFYLAFSKYGNIVLGKKGEKPKFSYFSWGAMMFCCGVSGSVPYWGFSEWLLYSNEPYIQNLGNKFDFSNVYSFFFWSNYWFYLVLAVCFGFMMHVRLRNKQRYSEVIRPIIGKHSYGIIGKTIDIFAIVAIIGAVTCSLAVSTPVVTLCLNVLCDIPNNNFTTLVVLIITCIIYSISLANGLKGINKLSRICVYVFLGLIIYLLLFGGYFQYIIESTFKQIGLLIDNLFFVFTDIDPTRKSSFVLDYCVFYNAYWLTWAITVPYFIGVISRGRTIREVLLGGILFAVPGTIICFSVLTNYAEAIQIFGISDINAIYKASGDLYQSIIAIIKTIPCYKLFMIALIISMMCLNATSFDSISLTCAYYSYMNITNDQKPNKYVKQAWAIILILLPTALIFSENTLNNLTTLIVIFGFPGGILLLLVVISFFKDVNNYINDNRSRKRAEMES